MCLQETSSSGSKRRKTKGGEKEGVRWRRGRSATVPRGSIHQHHIGGSDKEVKEEVEEGKIRGLETWTSKRLYALFQKYVGLKQMRSPRCPNKVQNKTKGKEGAAAET